MEHRHMQLGIKSLERVLHFWLVKITNQRNYNICSLENFIGALDFKSEGRREINVDGHGEQLDPGKSAASNQANGNIINF